MWGVVRLIRGLVSCSGVGHVCLGRTHDVKGAAIPNLLRPFVQDAPAKQHPGEVLEIESEEELDRILQEDKDSLTILLGSLTWCRPCKALAKPLQVNPALSNGC